MKKTLIFLIFIYPIMFNYAFSQNQCSEIDKLSSEYAKCIAEISKKKSKEIVEKSKIKSAEIKNKVEKFKNAKTLSETGLKGQINKFKKSKTLSDFFKKND